MRPPRAPSPTATSSSISLKIDGNVSFDEAARPWEYRRVRSAAGVNRFRDPGCSFCSFVPEGSWLVLEGSPTPLLWPRTKESGLVEAEPDIQQQVVRAARLALPKGQRQQFQPKERASGRAGVTRGCVRVLLFSKSIPRHASLSFLIVSPLYFSLPPFRRASSRRVCLSPPPPPPAMLANQAASTRGGVMASRPDLRLKEGLMKVRDYRAVHGERTPTYLHACLPACMFSTSAFFFFFLDSCPHAAVGAALGGTCTAGARERCGWLARVPRLGGGWVIVRHNFL